MISAGATNTTAYLYDVNGSRTNKTAGGNSTTYAWDVNNRLVEASTNGSPVFVASYDYRTRRLVKDEGTPIYFRYDGGVSFHETTGGTNPVLDVEYVRGTDMGGGIGSILYRVTGTVSTNTAPSDYFVYNAVGSVVALPGTNGAVQADQAYEAFGNIVGANGSTDINRLANTKEFDSSIGLYNHGHRYYDPEIGRYISRDPIGYGDGMNVYAYVHNNPITGIDPEGLGLLDPLRSFVSWLSSDGPTQGPSADLQILNREYGPPQWRIAQEEAKAIEGVADPAFTKFLLLQQMPPHPEVPFGTQLTADIGLQLTPYPFLEGGVAAISGRSIGGTPLPYSVVHQEFKNAADWTFYTVIAFGVPQGRVPAMVTARLEGQAFLAERVLFPTELKGFIRISGTPIRKVIMRPSTAKWGLTTKHLNKHLFGNNLTSLKSIDPAGNPDRWMQQLADLFNSPVTSTTPNGKVDIIKEFPRADGRGTFKLGIRLSPNNDGTFDLVTILTKQ